MDTPSVDTPQVENGTQPQEDQPQRIYALPEWAVLLVGELTLEAKMYQQQITNLQKAIGELSAQLDEARKK